MSKPDTQRRHRPGRRLALALLLVLPLAAVAGPRPARVVSVNLCTDQLLLMLADASQVASVSFLAREPKSSFVSTQAGAYPVNHARAEEVIALRPDLVLATAYTPPRLISTLKRLGYRVELFHLDNTVGGIVTDIRRMAALLDQPARGAVLVKDMQRRLAGTADVPAGERPSALFYQPRGYTSGRHTLQDEALRLAGWRNPAAEHGIEGYAPVDLERLLLWRPQRIFTSDYDGTGDSLAQRGLDHPALRKLLAGRPPLQIPYKYWICPGPMLADAVELLRRARNDPDLSHAAASVPVRSRGAATP